ncbi:hypothetical protein ACET3X_006279 [Alternaria dauci]|uniref:Uncharacterized protein n=1 Tax=Alternaria dauci TaxID=48095 RepID=A0ABR3UJ78_9PLEO
MSGVKQATFSLTLKEGHAEETLENLRKALDAYPILEDLNLIAAGVYPGSLQDILLCAAEGQLFSRLTSVSLDSLDLVPDGSRPFCHNFDVTKLQQLRLKNCFSLVFFLDSLTESYSEMSGVLKMLSIESLRTNDRPVETISSIERFLKACPKLEDIFLALAKFGCVGKDCLLPHADTLRSLVVGNDMAEKLGHFSKHDLGSIMKACKKLERLAINFPPVKLGSISKLGRDFYLNGTEQGSAELEGVLAELAQCSTLHTLGMLSRPELASSDIVDENGDRLPEDVVTPQLYEVTMQNFANQVLRYMAKQGLPPNVFHIENMHSYGLASCPIDRLNGHDLRHYTYTSGSIQDSLGFNMVVAVPLRSAYREYPDNFIIQRATT